MWKGGRVGGAQPPQVLNLIFLSCSAANTCALAWEKSTLKQVLASIKFLIV